jgi:hypothetical protein
MDGTAAPASLPGQTHGVTLEDLDDVQLATNNIRADAALQPKISLSLPNGQPPGLRKAASFVAEHRPAAANSLHSVVKHVNALSHIAANQKKRVSGGVWVLEVFFFTCFICVLSALLIESRDTTSIFT